ncbi:MAG: DMT family transporter [Geminicoccaceae bacterium]
MIPFAQNLRAAGLIAAAMALFGVSDAFIKYVTIYLPVGQIMALRGLLMALLFLAVLRRQGHRFTPRLWLHPWNLARGASEILCAAFYFQALNHLPLGEATTLFFIAPVLLTATAALFLGEQVGWQRWAAVAMGFAGVLIVAGPPRSWSIVILLPLAAAALSVLRDVLTRRVPHEVPAAAVSLVTAASMSLGGFSTAVLGWPMPSPGQLGLLLLSALIVGLGYQCYVLAIRRGELSFVSPFRYVAVPLAILLGLIGWGEVPGPAKLFGAAIIVGSGLFIFHRERLRSRAVAA